MQDNSKISIKAWYKASLISFLRQQPQEIASRLKSTRKDIGLAEGVARRTILAMAAPPQRSA